jgi:ribonucleotide monophosphatase NagD (HAD superfamily)
MTDLQFPDGLAELAPQYDTILCDVWGVIHNGRAAFAEACDALVKFREAGGQVCLITNAPVPEAQVVRYF